MLRRERRQLMPLAVPEFLHGSAEHRGEFMKRLFWWTGILLVVATAGTLAAEDTPQYDRIEEDWEVLISEPSQEDEAPQILNVLSPGGTYDTSFFVFELNHCTQPDYTAGGMQLQRWTGDSLRSWTVPQNVGKLSYPQETISYTLRMRLFDEYLSVSVRNGHSETWGDFGGTDLRLYSWTDLHNLNGYRTSHSTAKSRIGFASYRVTKFLLKEVRYYSHGELVQTDETDVVVHEYQP